MIDKSKKAPMLSLEKVPKSASIILTLSLSIPLLFTAFPHLGRFFLLEKNCLMPITMLTSIFLAPFNLQLLVTCLMRFQVLCFIETIVKNEIEILFYSTLFVFPFILSYFIEGIRTFNDSINMAYVYMLSQHQTWFNVFGFSVKNHFLPYMYLGIDVLLSNGKTKAYYGLLYGIAYFKLKRHGFDVPAWFHRFCKSVSDRINRPSGFKGRGHKIRNYR